MVKIGKVADWLGVSAPLLETKSSSVPFGMASDSAATGMVAAPARTAAV